MNITFIAKKTFKLIIKYIWFVILLGIVGHFMYQSSFSWEEAEIKSNSTDLTNEEEVVFVVIKEEFAGVKKNGFDSLSDSLKTWEFDKKNKNLYLKYTKDLPYSSYGEGKKKEIVYGKTKVIVLYDRGFDSFERYSEVLSISSLPYKYYFKDEPLITVHDVDSDGTVFLEFKGKLVQLKSGDSYPDLTVKGFHLAKTEIVNHGIYKKTQFLPLIDETKKDSKKKDGEKSKKTNPDSDGVESETPEEKKEKLPNIHS